MPIRPCLILLAFIALTGMVLWGKTSRKLVEMERFAMVSGVIGKKNPTLTRVI